jgi:hypothetical protein
MIYPTALPSYSPDNSSFVLITMSTPSLTCNTPDSVIRYWVLLRVSSARRELMRTLSDGKTGTESLHTCTNTHTARMILENGTLILRYYKSAVPMGKSLIKESSPCHSSEGYALPFRHGTSSSVTGDSCEIRGGPSGAGVGSFIVSCDLPCWSSSTIVSYAFMIAPLYMQNLIAVLWVINAYDFILRGSESMPSLLEINYKFWKLNILVKPQNGWPETGGQRCGWHFVFFVSRVYGIYKKDCSRISWTTQSQVSLSCQVVGH